MESGKEAARTRISRFITGGAALPELGAGRTPWMGLIVDGRQVLAGRDGQINLTKIGRVRCVECGFLEKHSLFNAEGKPLDTQARDGIRDDTNDEITFLRCHLLVADLGEGLTYHTIQDKTTGQALRNLEYASGMMRNAVKPRSCSYFYKYHPGYSPSEHRGLKEAASKSDRDRLWDIVKIVGGALIGAAGKSLWDAIHVWLRGG